MRLLHIALFLAAAATAWAAPRVALTVTAPADTALWQSVLTAELTRLAPDTELVERAELARLWAERETTALGARPSATPAPTNVDHYLHFRSNGADRWIVLLIDAATGREIGSHAVQAPSPTHAGPLAAAATRLLSQAATNPAPPETQPRVAVVEADSVRSNAEQFTFAARLRTALADEQITVLDRTLTQELAIERNDADQGFRATAATGKLLGLDYWIELSERDARLVRTRDLVVLGVTPVNANDPAEINRLQTWALPLLGQPPGQTISVYLPQVEIEALQPYHRGIARYDSGEYAAAVIEFTRAYRLNGRFREAYEWAARSYDALGMPQVASAIRRYLGTEFLENQPAATGRISPTDGIGFLGIQSTAPLAPLALDLSAVTASTLANRTEIGLRLPEQLQRLRREYDWMSLDSAEPGRDITNAPGLLTRFVLNGTLSQTGDTITLRWTLRDSLGLRAPAIRTLALPRDTARRNQTLTTWLLSWPKLDDFTTPENPAPPNTPTLAPDSAENLSRKIRSTEGDETELLRLQLMQLEPAAPLAAVRGPGKHDEPLASFIEHGKRDYLISRLPAKHTQRRWLELMRAIDHRNPYGGATVIGGRPLDAHAELARLAQERPDDGPGLLARHYLIFDGQARRPPADTAALCNALLTDLQTKSDHIPEISEKLTKAVTGLAQLAQIADGEHERTGTPPDTELPVPVEAGVLRWTPEARLDLIFKRHRILWRPLHGLTGDDLIRNAKAQLELNAYLRSKRFCDPLWLKRYPRTITLADRIVRALSSASGSERLLLNGPDGRAQTEQHLRDLIAYVVDTVEYTSATSTNDFTIKNAYYLAQGLATTLGNSRLGELIPPEDFDAIHARLVTALDRESLHKRANSRTFTLFEVTREIAVNSQRDDLDDDLLWIPDAAHIRDEQLKREESFQPRDGKPANPSPWWWLAVRWEADKAFTATERAALLSRRSDDAIRLMPKNPSQAYLDRAFDLGLILLYGRKYAEAEHVFSYLTRLDPGDQPTRDERTRLANTLFRLAQIQHVNGRKPEGLAHAARALEVIGADQLDYFTHSHDYVHNEGDLAARVSRLIVEMRFNPARAILPERVQFVTVPTDNADNPNLCVYYRHPPPPFSNAKTSTPRVLLLAPVTNEDPLHYLAPDSPWTRFADAHNLVLASPRFVTSDYAFHHDHAFSHQRYAQAWSGDAVLRALDEIGRRLSIDADKLLIHGQTSGGGFASHFAAWRPDRVAAVSIINSNWGVARLNAINLQPPAAQRHIRYWVAANPLDDTDMPRGRRRYIYQVDLASRLRHAGVPLDWSEWPDPDHTPAPEVEVAARAFLARQLMP